MAQTTRAQREKKTVEVMIKLYCKDNHKTESGLCTDCQELLTYSLKRADKCMFGEDKPVCGNCTVHCYKKDMREKIRVVMRYSGPRMILQHPVMAIQHLVDKKHKPQSKNEEIS
ncbi:nitrous oxide-stimulated promoter family protein [Desulfitobacterium sp. THU1]|uniref:nitrous oxide-stimulated promoter family protein n=1 Tax=Desulfitobacterium sp. THU1 TaxID=3138072 RepID=UPI0031204E68